MKPHIMVNDWVSVFWMTSSRMHVVPEAKSSKERSEHIHELYTSPRAIAMWRKCKLGCRLSVEKSSMSAAWGGRKRESVSPAPWACLLRSLCATVLSSKVLLARKDRRLHQHVFAVPRTPIVPRWRTSLWYSHSDFSRAPCSRVGRGWGFWASRNTHSPCDTVSDYLIWACNKSLPGRSFDHLRGCVFRERSVWSSQPKEWVESQYSDSKAMNSPVAAIWSSCTSQELWFESCLQCVTGRATEWPTRCQAAWTGPRPER